MSLTIPQAGLTAGRSANVAQFAEASRTPDDLAQFGQIATKVGNAMEADRLGREMQTAQTDMTRDLNQLRLETEQIGDPDEFEGVWAAGVRRIEAAYLGDDGRLSVQNRSDFQNRFNQLRDSMSFQLGMRGVGLRQSQTVANIAAWEHEAGLAAAGLDGQGRAELAATGEAQIAAAVASGAMTPAQGQTRLLQMRGGLDAARAQALTEDPDAMIAALDAGELNGLGGEEGARLRARAEGQIAANAANGTTDNIKALNGYAIELVADDPETFLQLAEEGLFSNLPPETLSRHKVSAQSAIDGATTDTVEGRAISVLSSDPDGYLVQDAEGAFASLSPQQQARYRAAAQNAIARREEDLAKDAARAAEARQKDIGARLADTVALVDNGRGRAVALDQAFLADPETMKHPDFPRTMAALQLHAEYGNLPRLTVAELSDLITEERANPATEAYQTERLAVLVKARDDAARGWTSRPLAHAAEIGIDVPPLDIKAGISDPQQLAAQLATRIAYGDAIQKLGYTTRPVSLSDDERAQFLEATGADADPAQRLAIAEAANAAGMAPGEISDDRLFGYAQGLLSDGTARTTVSRMLRGQAIMKERNIIMPPLADRLGPAHSHVAAFFADMPGGERLQAEVIEAADALYATQRRRADPAGDIDTDLYRQALHDALGGTGKWDDDTRARGGLQTVGTAVTLLPQGVSGAEATAGLTFLTRARSTMEQTAQGELVRSGDDLTRRIAINGDLPLAGGEVISSRTLRESRIVAVGPDRYQLVWDTVAGTVTAGAEDGAPWTFSLMRLVQEAAR